MAQTPRTITVRLDCPGADAELLRLFRQMQLSAPPREGLLRRLLRRIRKGRR